MKKNNGFTIIELSIVIAITAILVLFVTPTYMAYTKRTAISEGIQLALEAKSKVALYYLMRDQLPIDNAVAQLAPPKHYASHAVAAIGVHSRGVFIEYTPNFALQKSSSTFNFARPQIILELDPKTNSNSQFLQFNCLYYNISPKYVPDNCKPLY